VGASSRAQARQNVRKQSHAKQAGKRSMAWRDTAASYATCSPSAGLKLHPGTSIVSTGTQAKVCASPFHIACKRR
jgi:hypothetical protein